MSEDKKTIGGGFQTMEKVLPVFMIAFLFISAFSLGVSVFWGKDKNLSESCRKASSMAFIISVILLYLGFVLR